MRSEVMQSFAKSHLGQALEFAPLAGDASFRRYVRLHRGRESFMLMDAPPEKEPVAPFMAVGNFLQGAGFSAPHILAADEANGFLLLEDLGDDSFSKLLKQNPSDQELFYNASVAMLAHWHQDGLDTQKLTLPLYDNAVLMREVQLLSNWFLPQYLDGEKLAGAQESYVKCWQDLLNAHPLTTTQFVHRDFHADNLMWLPSRESHARIGLLDFQDALYGDAAYDLVSLLEDARRDVPEDFAEKMIYHYVQLSGADATGFGASYALLAAQRNAKIIGIFTRLAARDGKMHYLNFLPRVWGYMARDVKHPLLTPLAKWLAAYVPADKRGVIAIRKDARALGLAV